MEKKLWWETDISEELTIFALMVIALGAMVLLGIESKEAVNAIGVGWWDIWLKGKNSAGGGYIGAKSIERIRKVRPEQRGWGFLVEKAKKPRLPVSDSLWHVQSRTINAPSPAICLHRIEPTLFWSDKVDPASLV